MPNHEPPRAPDGLGPAATRYWDHVVRDFALLPHQLSVLETACNAKEIESKCLAVLAAEGFTIATGQGMVRARPECTILRDARAAFLRAAKDLALDVG